MPTDKQRLETLISWYEQFSHVGPIDWGVPDANSFWKVRQEDIQKCEEVTGVKFPEYYKEFLLRVGEGRFKLGNNEVTECTYKNVFLGPQDIQGILSKESDCWLVFPDEYIYPNEFPFFDIGSCGVFVFSEKSCVEGKVFHPGGFERSLAESFADFLFRLRENTEFYTNAGVQG
jgi:SMI1 / KNR4 family (SUKH-1)